MDFTDEVINRGAERLSDPDRVDHAWHVGRVVLDAANGPDVDVGCRCQLLLGEACGCSSFLDSDHGHQSMASLSACQVCPTVTPGILRKERANVTVLAVKTTEGRLGVVMDALGITGNELARRLGEHPDWTADAEEKNLRRYVRRWKTGRLPEIERTVSSGSRPVPARR